LIPLIPRPAEFIESMLTAILFVMSASAPTWRLKLKPSLYETLPLFRVNVVVAVSYASLAFVAFVAAVSAPILLAFTISAVCN